jgi:tRNA modification GTPase
VSGLAREDQTIAAIATAPVSAAIGIVRVSGMSAKEIAMRIFRPKRQVHCLESHRVYYGLIYAPVSGVFIDEALVMLMQAPHSYTREDVLEIQCHGGPAVTRRILEAVLACGAREADPGEFTRRAFLNGRIDLAQAEAVMELVTAATDLQRQAAIGALSGNMSRSIHGVREEVVDVLARIEAELDFPEDGLEFHSATALCRSISEKILHPIHALLASYDTRHIVRDGVRVVMAGRPNTGKSSLFNGILGTSRVLVSPVPGTTRDSIEENLDINGLLVTLVDTAGIRQETSDTIESMGMDIAQREMERANHLLVLIDCSLPLTHEDLHLLGSIHPGRPVTVVLNKIDLLKGPFAEPSCLQDGLNVLPVTAQIQAVLLEKGISEAVFLPVSAKTGFGLDRLKERIANAALSDRAVNCDFPIPTLRQRDILMKAAEAFESAQDLLKNGKALEIVAIELRNGLSGLNEMLGLEANEDVLNRIFSRFCIGK